MVTGGGYNLQSWSLSGTSPRASIIALLVADWSKYKNMKNQKSNWSQMVVNN